MIGSKKQHTSRPAVFYKDKAGTDGRGLDLRQKMKSVVNFMFYRYHHHLK